MAEGSIITEELRKLIGVTAGEPVTFKVEEGAIQRYAQAIGDPNPLYNDVEYAAKSRHGRLMCPPGFTGWPVKAGGVPMFELVEALVKAGAPPRLLDGGIEYEFLVPMGAGDVLTATTKVADIVEKEGKSGKFMLATIETTFVNQNGDVAVRALASFINR